MNRQKKSDNKYPESLVTDKIYMLSHQIKSPKLRAEAGARFPGLYMESFTVAVLLKNAKDLIAADLNGKSDPYCKITVISPEKFNNFKKGTCPKPCSKSKTIYKTLNPTWDEKIQVVGWPGGVLLIDVMDYDKVGSHDPLGFTGVPLANLQPGKEQEFSEKLKGVSTGTLNFAVTLPRDANNGPPATPQKAATPPPEKAVSSSSGSSKKPTAPEDPPKEKKKSGFGSKIMKGVSNTVSNVATTASNTVTGSIVEGTGIQIGSFLREEVSTNILDKTKNLPLVCVILSMQCYLTYDDLFIQYPPESSEGRVALWSMEATVGNLRKLNKLFEDHDQKIPHDPKSTSGRFLSQVSSLHPSQVLINFECSEGLNDPSAEETTPRAYLRLLELIIKFGFYAMWSDLSVYGLTEVVWRTPLLDSEPILGKNPFIMVHGAMPGNMDIRFDPEQLKNCPCDQLQMLGEFCENGKATISGGQYTIYLFSIDSSIDMGDVKVEALTVAISCGVWKLETGKVRGFIKNIGANIKELEPHQICTTPDGRYKGVVGQATVTYPSGAVFILSAVHWCNVAELETSESAVLNFVKRTYGEGYQTGDIKQFAKSTVLTSPCCCIRKRTQRPAASGATPQPVGGSHPATPPSRPSVQTLPPKPSPSPAVSADTPQPAPQDPRRPSTPPAPNVPQPNNTTPPNQQSNPPPASTPYTTSPPDPSSGSVSLLGPDVLQPGPASLPDQLVGAPPPYYYNTYPPPSGHQPYFDPYGQHFDPNSVYGQPPYY